MNTIKCLDHGFVTLHNISNIVPRYDIGSFSGIDTDPATCARISFNNFNEDRTKEQDLKLVEYLLKNHHNTPIEMTEIWLEMKLPIFLARQFVRHRTACLSEVSGRYTTLPKEWYIPEIVGGKPTNGTKQGQEDSLKFNFQDMFKQDLDAICAESYDKYLYYLEGNVAPEHARLFLHVNHYTHWIWKQDLSNMMHFLSLRLDSHAQVEARIYAQAIYDLLSQHLPETMKFFDKYKRL